MLLKKNNMTQWKREEKEKVNPRVEAVVTKAKEEEEEEKET